MGDEIQKAETGTSLASTSEGFGTKSLARANETSATAIAAQARAQIEARYIVALKNPRNIDDVRTRLLKECARPGFARVARYSKPVGGAKIEGPSIRFAEAALRCMTNVTPESFVIWDDEEKRIIRVSVTDVESNLTYSTDVVIEKTVERQKLQPGQQPLSSRSNSYGKIVYTVRATEDDLLNKQNAQISKAMRTAALRLLPGDILEDCMDAVLITQKNEDAQDPEAARKKLLDAFAKLNVMPSQLAEYLGHDTTLIVPAELVELRGIYSALSDGETSWSAVMASRKPDASSEEQSAQQKAVDAVKNRVAKNTSKQQSIDSETGEVKP